MRALANFPNPVDRSMSHLPFEYGFLSTYSTIIVDDITNLVGSYKLLIWVSKTDGRMGGMKHETKVSKCGKYIQQTITMDGTEPIVGKVLSGIKVYDPKPVLPDYNVEDVYLYFGKSEVIERHYLSLDPPIMEREETVEEFNKRAGRYHSISPVVTIPPLTPEEEARLEKQTKPLFPDGIPWTTRSIVERVAPEPFKIPEGSVSFKSMHEDYKKYCEGSWNLGLSSDVANYKPDEDDNVLTREKIYKAIEKVYEMEWETEGGKEESMSELQYLDREIEGMGAWLTKHLGHPSYKEVQCKLGKLLARRSELRNRQASRPDWHSYGGGSRRMKYRDYGPPGPPPSFIVPPPAYKSLCEFVKYQPVPKRAEDISVFRGLRDLINFKETKMKIYQVFVLDKKTRAIEKNEYITAKSEDHAKLKFVSQGVDLLKKFVAVSCAVANLPEKWEDETS